MPYNQIAEWQPVRVERFLPRAARIGLTADRVVFAVPFAAHSSSPPDVAAARWVRSRGESVSRIEAFSDGVYAFAVTLLVLSLEVPQSFDQLRDLFRGLPAFAICFAILAHNWYLHHRFFRRYGLDDAWTVTLNAMLLFVLVLYLYPMKFMFTVAVYMLTGLGPHAREVPLAQAISSADVPALFVVFGIGFAAMNVLLSLLNLHAWRKREELRLTEVECFDNRSDRLRHLLLLLVPTASITVALGTTGAWGGAAGWIYFLCGVIEAAHATITAKKREALLRRLEAGSQRTNSPQRDVPGTA